MQFKNYWCVCVKTSTSKDITNKEDNLDGDLQTLLPRQQGVKHILSPLPPKKQHLEAAQISP